MHFDEWWNSAAADAFRAKFPNTDGSEFLPVWEAALKTKRHMFNRRPGLWAIAAREALELIASPKRPDGTWNRDREACRQMAAEVLGRYED